jgi:gas vesicle protein
MNERIYYSQEAAQRAQRDRLTMAMVVTGFGLGIGAILALLLAPRPGDETRQQIGDSIDQATHHGRDVANQVFKTVREGAGKLQEEVNERLQPVVNR